MQARSSTSVSGSSSCCWSQQLQEQVQQQHVAIAAAGAGAVCGVEWGLILPVHVWQQCTSGVVGSSVPPLHACCAQAALVCGLYTTEMYACVHYASSGSGRECRESCCERHMVQLLLLHCTHTVCRVWGCGQPGETRQQGGKLSVFVGLR